MLLNIKKAKCIDDFKSPRIFNKVLRERSGPQSNKIVRSIAYNFAKNELCIHSFSILRSKYPPSFSPFFLRLTKYYYYQSAIRESWVQILSCHFLMLPKCFEHF